jgi:hypothetical protein
MFPKQPSIGRGYGNWLRLFGRHHTLDHWSRFFRRGQWLEGGAAVRSILSLRLAPAALVPAAPPPLHELPPGTRPLEFGSGTRGSISRRVGRYVARVPNFAEGEGRNSTAFRIACWLRNDMLLPDPEAWKWLAEWNTGNAPPLTERELRACFRSAGTNAKRAPGAGLAPAAYRNRWAAYVPSRRRT